MEHEKEPELEQAKQHAWEIENECLRMLLANGSAQYFKQNFPNLKLAFVKEMTAVVCIDEGCAHQDYNGQGKLTLAGAGILFPARSEEERIKIVSELFFEMGIQDVVSHEGCGAVGLAYRRDFPESAVGKEELEAYGKEWVKKIIEEKERMGHEARAGHMTAEDMKRPSEFHIARAVYFDAVGGFNPHKEAGLPAGFVISRRFLPREYAAEELKVAVNIAFGHHGFGGLFTADAPLVIISFADSDARLADLKKEVTDALKENKNYRENKIRIDGLVME